jgi:ABC-2 type transport system ATP-binding protein
MPSAAEAAPPIETHGLSRRFGSVAAVDAVSLTVAPGEIFGLIGSNGAGKSTLVKMLTTLLPPTAGSARVAGFDIAREAAAVRAHIGYVPQFVSCDGTLTGYENMLLSARLYGLPPAGRRALIEETLGAFELMAAARRR